MRISDWSSDVCSSDLPAEADPVLATAEARGWRIDAIWNTHWHPDHTGGNQAIKHATGAQVYGPAAEAGKIPTLDHGLREGDTVRLGDPVAIVIETPAHPPGHVRFHLAGAHITFVGATSFSEGCGRLFADRKRVV